jgi:PAS domain S-box-containing protein
MDTNRRITIAFGAGLVAVATVVLFSVVVTQRLIHESQWVAHSHEVRSTLRQLDAQIRESKSDVRSFIISGDSAYVLRYAASFDSAQAAFASLQHMTRDNAKQQGRLRALRTLLDERHQSLESTLTLWSRRGVGSTTEASASPHLIAQLAMGEDLSTRLGRMLDTLDRSEVTLLSERSAAQHDSELAIRAMVVAFALAGLTLAWLMRRSVRLDLEARSRVERALRESEAKFSGILTIAADAIITVDEEQRIRHFNHGAEQIFGYRERELLGQPLETLMPPRLAPTHGHHVASFAHGSETARHMGQRRQVLGRRKSGEEFPADVSISKLVTADGLLFTAVLRDVSEQKRTERDEHLLAEAGRRLVDTIEYDTILQVVADLPVPDIGDWCVIDVLDRSSNGRVFQRAASRLRSTGHRELAAWRTLERIALDQDSPSRIVDVVRTGKPELIAPVDDSWLEAHTGPLEYAALRLLGTSSMIIVPLTAGAQPVGAMTVGVGGERRPLDALDVEVLQALSARASLALANGYSHALARRATAARDEVLSVVSHDLRNPLSAVSMCARTLLEHPPATEGERQKLYRSTLDAADWMNHLMQDLVDAASIDAGRLSVAADTQSVSQLLDASVEMLSARSQADGVKVVIDASRPLPFVNADETRVIQVLSNLLSNAIKYSPRGATVTLGATPNVDDVTIWIRDRGAGIAPEHLPHVFDRFWHVRGASRVRGSGLGLAIARGIVGAHGGRIWVESEVGVGSTFFFTLPIARRSNRLDAPSSSIHAGRMS